MRDGRSTWLMKRSTVDESDREDKDVLTSLLLTEDDDEIEADIGLASGSCGGSGLLSTSSCCASVSPVLTLLVLPPPLPAAEVVDVVPVAAAVAVVGMSAASAFAFPASASSLSSSSSLLSRSLTVLSSCCGMGPALTPPHPTGTYWKEAVAVSRKARLVRRSSNSSDTSSTPCHASRMSEGSEEGMWERALRLRLVTSETAAAGVVVGAGGAAGDEASALREGELMAA